MQADDTGDEKWVPKIPMEAAKAEMKNPAPVETSPSEEVVGISDPSTWYWSGKSWQKLRFILNAEILPENIHSETEIHDTSFLN